MSVAVMSRTNMRTSQASVYLIALALADIIVLYTGLLRHFIKEVSGVDIRHFSTASCKLHPFLVYTSLDTSVWILVAFTGERIISVYLPYKVKNICTRFTSLVLVGVILVVMFALNSHFLYGMSSVTEVQNDNSTWSHPCYYINSEYQEFVNHDWPWIDFCVFNLVPFTLLSIGNLCIAIRVIRSRRRAKKVGPVDLNQATTNIITKIKTVPATHTLSPFRATANGTTSASRCQEETKTAIFNCAFTPPSCVPATFTSRAWKGRVRPDDEADIRSSPSGLAARSSFSPEDQAPPARSSRKNDRISSMTVILLLLNMVFLVTTTPVSVFFIIHDNWKKRTNNDIKEYALYRLTFTVVNLIQYMNNSINFIFYCITSSRFRKELQAMIFRKNRVAPNMVEKPVRQPRPLEHEVTGLHTRTTIASDIVVIEQAQPNRNILHIPGAKSTDTRIQ
ncbi:growth hormone secretagogue receptor type 1-like [Plakobranchus ocellatus]|uniref:Growth hormone secretagogue receptor type 1-like n=1 Tax=Plakobranchus ocellatus TaxID=259542 RepID=A0AAV4CB06_9GAST|nr:growth hormone secretagogue receptor type 1-like [Plakobranchus ocellatus]